MEPQGWSTPIGIWVGAIGTLCLYSLLYRENRAFRLVEHLFIGLGAGYLIKNTWDETLKPQWWDPMTVEGNWPWFFVAVIGLGFYAVYSKKYNWISRISIGILLGLISGQIFQKTAQQYLPLIRSTFKPIVNPPVPEGSGLTPLGIGLSNLVFVLIVLCVLSYFFFSFEQKNKVIQGTARSGRLMMMIAFGAIFGSTVMARMALLIDRVWFLMHNWLRLT